MKFITFKRQSKLIQNRLTKILEHCQTLSDLTQLNEGHKHKAFSLNEEMLEKGKEYHDIRDKLINTPDSTDETEESLLDDIESNVSDILIEIQTILRPLLSHSNSDSLGLNDSNTSVSTSRPNMYTSNVRLPKIQLKTFNGDISQWIAFYNIFDETVNKNKLITNIEKFQYLLSCLENEPLNLIKALPLSNDNYTIAYDTLLKRYHNPRVLKSLHVNHLIDMPNCQDTNAKTLRNFISQFREHSSALSSLNVKINEDSPVLITLLLRKFDITLRTRFESKRSVSEDLPTPEEFIAFLEDECSYMENAYLFNSNNVRHNVQTTPSSSFKPKPGFSRNKNVTLTAQDVAKYCTYCSSTHPIYICSDFTKLSPPDRFNFIKTNNYCVNCLGNHKFKECVSKNTCKECKKRHHTLLHLNTTSSRNVVQTSNNRESPNFIARNFQDTRKPSPVISQSTDTSKSVHSVCTANINNDVCTTILGTLLVKLNSSNGNSMVIRALIDSASSCSFLNSDVVNKLQLKRQFCKQTCQINGISTTSVHTKGLTHVNILTLNNKLISKQHPVLILDKITSDMPSARISEDVKNSLVNFKLADPNFDKRGPIQMLLGADLFMQIIKPAKYSLGDNLPFALDTDFGFVIIGKAPVIDENIDVITANCNTTLVCMQDNPLHKLLTNFWNVEQPPESSELTDAEIACEKHFTETYYRCPRSGKYTVKLPFKENPEKLGDSSSCAKKRFFSLENKFTTQPEFKQLYTSFMDDYQESGHMTLCSNENDYSKLPHCFLPHHGVFKESSTTTCLRVVFDASSKTSNNTSLNDLIHVGPKLHNDISTIITNFRRYPYVFTTDVKQMFRSIDLDNDDCKYQLIYWRSDPHKELSVYQLNTVTYGMVCSPYLANRVIQQLTDDEKENFPIAAVALRNHIYVDDIALGADSIDDAIQLQNDVICLLKRGGFHLRKWTANHERLLANIPKEFHGQPVHFRAPDQPIVSILGLQWIPSTDCFTYKINITEPKVCTKRSVLSDIAKIFDPCGFISPVVIFAKIFIQVLWTRGLEWDTPLPADLANQWQLFFKEFYLLEKLNLKRFFGVSFAVNIQLHGFCDASESAFGACIYLRTVDSLNNVRVVLVLAKTRVAPLKRTSLPRLELCSAYLLAQLMNYCLSLVSKQMKIDSVHAWTDSTVTLAWISTPSYKLKTFVGNRVAQIQELLPSLAWTHVASSHNPADCASRGLFPNQLIEHKLWWTGPNWLHQDHAKWPKTSQSNLNVRELPEFKTPKENVFVTTSETQHDILNNFSSWDKLQRIVAYLLRFKHNTSNPTSKLTGNLSLNELNKALVTICRTVQIKEFGTDYEILKKSKQCSTKLQNLSPFLDNDGLIRVGGRLKHANISSNAKHPILLPKSHYITALIVDFYHLKYLHAGPQLLQSLICQMFWILSARSLIRKRVHKCMTCFRVQPRTLYPKMGELPEARVNPSPCFQTTGLDYSGPFEVKIHTLRRAQIVKTYLCLFVCFATKAVHIEIASDLSTDTFIAALTRFIARRGAPTDVYLDNATNFVGASNQLIKVMKDLLRNETTKTRLIGITSQHCTKFHFIPPSAPHQGGIWESGIKSAKTHLKRVIGDRILTLEEFQTLSVRVEAILNSRPLCPLSSDPTEIETLTPGHFLIGRAMVSLPEKNYEDMPLNRLKRWQAIQAMTQRLWKRWQTEYLHTLQQRSKWTKHCANLEIDDLVLIHNHSTPPLNWPMGRVIATHPGGDGVTRVVTLRTANGIITRPVVKVSPLPK